MEKNACCSFALSECLSSVPSTHVRWAHTWLGLQPHIHSISDVPMDATEDVGCPAAGHRIKTKIKSHTVIFLRRYNKTLVNKARAQKISILLLLYTPTSGRFHLTITVFENTYS